MITIRNPSLMAHPTPEYMIGQDQLRGNIVCANFLGISTNPLPYSQYGSLLVTASPFPYFVDANPTGLRKDVQQVLPPKPPPGWLPQTTYRNYGGK